jgi:hypothetical protein
MDLEGYIDFCNQVSSPNKLCDACSSKSSHSPHQRTCAENLYQDTDILFGNQDEYEIKRTKSMPTLALATIVAISKPFLHCF